MISLHYLIRKQSGRINNILVIESIKKDFSLIQITSQYTYKLLKEMLGLMVCSYTISLSYLTRIHKIKD